MEMPWISKERRLTGNGLAKYGTLKNFCRAFALLLIKDRQFKTFSKAHIALNLN